MKRLWTTAMLLATTLPCAANEPSEADQLAWLNYHLAVAEAPGDVHSDQHMIKALALLGSVDESDEADTAPPSAAMRAYLARAQVAAARLEANVDAVRDSDPFLLVGDLGCWPKSRDMATCDHRRATLEPFAADNAYHGVALMAYAWIREDADAFLRAARLAAEAETYDSLPALGYQSLVARYQQVPMPAAAAPGVDTLARAYPSQVAAMAMSAAVAMPPYQHFVQPCRESAGELQSHCLAIARKMMLQGRNLVEVWIAQAVVRALGTPDDIAMAELRHRQTQWLQAQAMPLLIASENGLVAGMDDYFAATASEGEIAALQALLTVHGIAPTPPAGWIPASAHPASAK